MDIESTVETIASYIPDRSQLSGIMDNAASYTPTDLNIGAMGQFLLFFVLGSLLLSVIGRVVLGKGSSLNHSLSSMMAIIFVYAATICVYTFKPWDLDQHLSPLPFVTFFNDYLVIMPVLGIRPTVLCRELLSLIVLSFLVNILDILLPKGKTPASWYLLRFLGVVIAMVLHILFDWAFRTYLPNFLYTYSAAILLSILILLLTMGFLSAVIGLVLTVANPFVGAVYSFFFSNVVGKQLTKAVFTSAILCVMIHFIGEFGYAFLNISVASLASYVPLALVCLVLWFVIGHLL